MDCPRCGLAGTSESSCPRCGVVFAKLDRARPRPPLAQVSAAPPRHAAPWKAPVTAVGLAVVLAGVWLLAPRRGASPTNALPPPSAPTAPALGPSSLPDPPPSHETPLPPLPSFAPADAEGLSPSERQALDDLASRMRDNTAAVGSEDLRTIEAAFGRHPDFPAVRQMLEATLMRLAAVERRERRTTESEAHLRRAAALSPDSLPPRVALLDLLLETRDWTGAEAAARDILALSPRDPDALDRLAFALFRQDRSREAVDVLGERLAIRDSPEARALLARIQKGIADETGMTEQRLAHFNVRYDGQAHEDVGREVLRALERHYATLVITMDYEPKSTIPVILFSTEAYYDASGAPRWSGGVYDHLDGRIRVPIGGLTPSLGPEMDGTLIHELTHAFAAEITGGLTPADVNEGLAQYHEGKRMSSMLRPEALTALADGRIGGVAASYLEGLSFTEYLVGLRGQGGINDLLRAMGETRSVDEAFERVYGASAQRVRSAWRARLRQQHGS